jgi:two-component system sensor histidine kinase BaeS
VNRPTLRRELALAIGGVAVAAVLLTALLTIGLSRLGVRQRAEAELRRQVDSMSALAAGIPCATGIQAELRRELGPGVRFIPDGVVRPLSRLADAPSGELSLGGRRVVYASSPTSICGRSGTLYVLRAASDVPPLPEGFGLWLGLAGLVALLGSLGVAYLLARRMSKPLGELASSARALAKGTGRPAPPARNDPAEVAEVKDAFADMAGDLSSAREREKSFLLSVSHELRTPLTAVRGYGEALADGTATDAAKAGAVVVRESQRLERLVGDLMDLARLQSGEFSVHLVETDPAQIGSGVVDALSKTAEDAGVSLVVDAVDAPRVHTDPDRAHQMVANLVENALRVTPKGGRVCIEVRPWVITVLDSGPGIEAEDLKHAFERFYLWRRYRGDRPVGSGLGLAIVGELAQRLGVTVEAASTDEGSRFELRFHS